MRLMPKEKISRLSYNLQVQCFVKIEKKSSFFTLKYLINVLIRICKRGISLTFKKN